MIKEDIKSSRFNYILCDSKDALNYFYKNGLNKKTKVLTHSPGIELKKNINSINLFKNLSKREFILFNETINTLSLNVFNSLKSEKGVEHELAVLISIFCSDFNKFLLKACHIKRKYLGKKVLFIKVSEKVGKADLINPPWDCFSKELNIKTLTYEPKDLHNSFIKEVKANYLKRTYLGGTETFIYRLLCKIYKFFNTLKKKNIIILSENELLIEVTHYLMLNGFFPIDFKNIANKFFENDINLTNLILKKTHKIIKKRIRRWVIPELRNSCYNFFKLELKNLIGSYLGWKKSFEKEINALNLSNTSRTLAFTNYPGNVKGLAAKNILGKKKISLYSFQHGVTAEISATDSANNCRHESTSSNYFFSFNEAASLLASSNPFCENVPYLYGAPKRYFRQNIPFTKKDIDILFLSNKLYSGNFGSLSTWVSDIEKAKIEIDLCKVLSVTNKKITYKKYIETFKRYLEEDPCISEIKKIKNINITNYNYDARYLISKARLIICCTASSTLSWAILSEKPVIYINFKYHASLLPSIKEAFKLGIFVFEYNNKNFRKNLKSFINKPYKEINKEWIKKKEHRNKLIKKYISGGRKLELKKIFNSL